MSAQYPDSGVMKEVVLKYEILENGCDILDPRDNGFVIGIDEESINSVVGMDV